MSLQKNNPSCYQWGDTQQKAIMNHYVIKTITYIYTAYIKVLDGHNISQSMQYGIQIK